MWQSIKEGEQRITQEGDADDVNPRLKRTGWRKHLMDLNHEDLIRCTTKPDEEEEPVAHATWQIRVRVDRALPGQRRREGGDFRTSRGGRTEKQQTRYQSLKTYKEAKDLTRNSRPWQQILMVLARTKEEHEWSSPR
jgi:hypothetical protein